MATAVLGADRQAVTTAGRRFWKMTGSGNDFVFIDGRTESVAGLDEPAVVKRLCSRTLGIGADGVVFLESAVGDQFRIRYYNRDGTRGELCGNASLCSSSLAVRLGLGQPEGFTFGTDVGRIAGRIVAGKPEIDLQPATGLRPDAQILLAAGERRIGFVDTGVPHLVVLVDDVGSVDVLARGAELRRHPSLPAGANVNFVSPCGTAWRMRTFERGVEDETLACGTGAAACAILLQAWALQCGHVTTLVTSSALELDVSTRPDTDGTIRPSLRGEGRLIFSGEVADL